jgi:dihydrolipoamide dehydrogenase
VLGGGPVGIELAQMLRRFGAAVHVVEQQPRLLAREDERVGELIMDALRADEIDVHLDAELQSVQADGDERVVDLGERTIRARELLVATSRKPRLDGLRLDRAGIDPGEKGIEVDHRCRAGDGVWAIGDVTGAMPFSHVAKYQGRIAVADILGQAANADYGAIPRAVFCDPEVAAVGLTASEARQQYSEVAIGHVQLREQIARPWTYETDPRGELALIVDRTSDLLVGAWAVAPHASEWIHYAALAIKAQVPVRTLVDTVAQFPTYCEAYLSALEQLS